MSSTHTAVALAGRYSNEVWAAHGNNCAACHSQGRRGPVGWVAAGIEADPGMLEFHKLVSAKETKLTAIDRNCLECHRNQDFHEPNAVGQHSCSACHKEHMGSGRMKDPETANCLACHASEQVMRRASETGSEIIRRTSEVRFAVPPSGGIQGITEKPWGGTNAASRRSPDIFNIVPNDGLHHFATNRPSDGYTKVFRAFADGHPAFQLHRSSNSPTNDPTILEFNHEQHIGAKAKPRLNGQPLDCAFCHKPDSTGAYKQPVTFDQSCRACHDLQFDFDVPELKIPHGDPAWVDAFVGSLLTQYRMFAIEKLGMKKEEAADFARKREASFKERNRIADENDVRKFIRDRILFSTATESDQISDQAGRTSPTFTGCNYCHTVVERKDIQAHVIEPNIPDRWFAHGKFNHAKHLHVACIECHRAPTSRKTVDVLLPTKESCAVCHSPHVASNPKSGVVSECITCHSFHAPVGEVKVAKKFVTKKKK